MYSKAGVFEKIVKKIEIASYLYFSYAQKEGG